MSSLGTYLRTERELRQISLEEISQSTRIPLRSLQYIEDDEFERLPGEVFTRGFLKSYAGSVGLEPADVLERLAKRGQPEEAPAAAPISTITAPESGGRFGIAIALVVLLILFTLALSIVMRPRQRNTPIELSDASSPIVSVELLG